MEPLTSTTGFPDLSEDCRARSLCRRVVATGASKVVQDDSGDDHGHRPRQNIQPHQVRVRGHDHLGGRLLRVQQ
eukprot:1184454-Prorocentrum_minimum.AAC.1